MYIDKITKQDLKEYISFCCEYNSKIDPDLAYINTVTYFKQHSGKKVNSNDMQEINRLFDQWYKSLEKNSQEPDYSVYADPYYMFEVWLSWVNYSRRYLKDIQKPKSLFGTSIADDMRNDGLNSILDLGCGFGYTTASLKEIFPDCSVYGTNFEDSLQFKMSKDIGISNDFTMLPDHKSITEIDLIFASEYFEHIINPIEHVEDIIDTCNPKYFLIASTFNQPAIGHFNQYNHGNFIFDGKTTSSKFNNYLRSRGYESIETGCWNNRPNYWKKKKYNTLSEFIG
jgi:SAM-dependent methyltransferase